MAELVDARDLKSLGAQSLYEFDSRPRHQQYQGVKLKSSSFFCGLSLSLALLPLLNDIIPQEILNQSLHALPLQYGL